ncbi:hypothetical protein [uncultured Gimesia sp.]|uniref:hypothetical protein n=1 Tax=uncultured Gimesia sp. TaxID=1678688 RepID=UPI0030DC1405
MLLTHRVLIILLLCTLGCSSQSQPTGTERERAEKTAAPAASQKIPSESYKEILYELGAYPVSKLSKPYNNDGHPGQVYSMGQRKDVHGWLSSSWVDNNRYRTKSKYKRYGTPKALLSYERYVSFLDVETYQRTKDPLLFAIIQFTLEDFRNEKLEIKNPEDFLKVYHAKMGLDSLVLRTLKGRGLTSRMVADLYQQYQDPLLFHYLTPPEAGQGNYKAFLEHLLADQKIDAAQRFVVFTQLYQADKPTHLAGYKNFIFENLDQLPDRFDRCQMYAALVGIGDHESVEAVNHALLNDPIAQVRQFLLRELKRQNQFVEYIDTIHLLSLGKAEKCRLEPYPNMRRHQPDENILAESLETYLNWAKKNQTLSPQTKRKILASLQVISNNFTNSFEPRSFGSVQGPFEANKPAQDK